jgi:hypothetical protein
MYSIPFELYSLDAENPFRIAIVLSLKWWKIFGFKNG